MNSVSPQLSTRLAILGRIFAAILGGYVLTWGFIALGMTSFTALGMEFEDAERLSNILGVLLFLMVFLWTFTARSLGRVWVVLAGGGVLMAAAAFFLQWTLV